MKFPLFSISGNKLVSLKGEASFLFKVNPPDIEQFSDHEIDAFYEKIHSHFKESAEGDFLKFFKIDDNIYLNQLSNSMGGLSNYFTSWHDELPLFFGQSSLEQEITFFEDYFMLNGKFCKLISLIEPPNDIYSQEFNGLGNFIINFKVLNQTKAKERVSLLRRFHFSKLAASLKDINSEKAFEDTEEILEELISGEEFLTSAEIFFFVTDTDKNAVDRKAMEICEKLKLRGGRGLVEAEGLAYFFNSLVPGVRTSFKRALKIPGRHLVRMLPFSKDFVHESGVEFKSRTSKVIHLDIFDKASTNFNVLVAGSSGQGKSMLCNKLLFEHVKAEGKALVVDLGGSFRKTVNFLGGIEISGSINPLSFDNPKYLKELIVSVVGVNNLGTKDQGKLLKVLKKHRFQKFSDLLSTLEAEFDGISNYFEEVLPYFDDKTVKTSNLNYVDFQNIPEVMKAPYLIFILELFKNMKGKRLLVFDECWDLLKSHDSFISECFRTFRKHNASAVAISQNIDDFMLSPLGKVIYQNSYYKVLFRQEAVESNVLPHFERELLGSISSAKDEYCEFLLLTETHRKPIRYFAIDLEYTLFNSSKEFNLKYSKYMEDYENYLGTQKAILHFSNLYHNGHFAD
ncbi:MAG: hypothetical protein HOE90_13055 [Bacteriovoracaceae bacterium]|nr:hypothetical protein [Bacteriovoracaceae bacterium]